MYHVIRRITTRGVRREFLVAKFNQHEHALSFILSKPAPKAGSCLYVHHELKSQPTEVKS